ncbi:hypothetical protein NDU88_004405 [Pleurodeles waltl]|uniref:Uncharacterized protein n=1 Tax=Pleurodeles waltl TaxID=8319 RepID=A0AAV7VK94_PLEWA|nr:hypothetical protein NDU88_004405 [Pleurodeles waltl]
MSRCRSNWGPSALRGSVRRSDRATARECGDAGGPRGDPQRGLQIGGIKRISPQRPKVQCRRCSRLRSPGSYQALGVAALATHWRSLGPEE